MPDGSTKRETLERVEQQTGRRPKELNGPPFPPAGLYLWRWWQQLHSRRRNGGMGPEPIGWGEIDAWCRFTGHHLAPWEVEVITALDDLWMGIQAETIQDERANEGKKAG